jgi:hypothetical protein
MGQVNDDSVPAGNEAIVWMLRAGRNGMYAAAFVENSYAVVGWGETGDVSAMPREALEKTVIQCFPDELTTSEPVRNVAKRPLPRGGLATSPRLSQGSGRPL